MQLTHLFVLALSFVAGVASQDTNLGAVRGAFNDANIPEDATITFNPSVLLEVTFPQTVGPSIQVTAGVQLPRNSTAIPPKFSVKDGNIHTQSEFVVAMVDLDAPTPQAPTLSQIRHFLGGNFHLVSGEDRQNLVNSTAALSEFLQPTPPAGSDPHRYVFLLFDQPRGFNQQTFVNTSTSVTNFNISQFAAEVGLGNPIGGSFIRVGPDPTIA